MSPRVAQVDSNLHKSEFSWEIKIEKISVISSDACQKNYTSIANRFYIICPINYLLDYNIVILFVVLSVSPTFTLFIIQELIIFSRMV